MTIELSNRHWVHFRHPRSEYEYRARLAVTSLDVDAVFEVQRRDATLGELGKWEDVEFAGTFAGEILSRRA